MPDKKDTFDSQVLACLKDNPTLTASGSIAAYVVVWLMLAADGDVRTALALASAISLFSVALSVTIALFSSVLFFLTLNSIAGFIDVWRDLGAFDWWRWLTVWIVLLGGVFLPVSLWLAAWLIPPLILGVRWLRERKQEDAAKRRVESFTLAFYALPVIVLLANPTWLPPEEIELEEGIVVGYVVEHTDSWTTILLEEDRSIFRTATGEIVGRSICSLSEGFAGRTIGDIVSGSEEHTYPKCPE